MFKRILTVIPVVLALVACLPSSIAARELSFEDRLRAQESIERVYYSHQEGASRPFEQVVTSALLERKVRTYLAQSVALERMWHTPVTTAMLRRELERMASRTRMPVRLQELFAALNDDPVLIQECLARQVLVDRLARNFFATDSRIHAQAKHDAEILHLELKEGRIDPWADHSSRRLVVLERRDQPPAYSQVTADREPGVLTLDTESYDRLRALAPRQAAAIGPVTGEREAYTLRVLLEEREDRASIASYAVPKRSWDTWWSEYGATLDVTAVEVVADSALLLPPAQTGRDRDCEGDTWENGILDDLPAGRSRHTAVWTGSRMIVWGGYLGNWQRSTGYLYDPATDSWSATSNLDAPSARSGHVAVWTGSEMIVWGGGWNTDTGARYNPISDSWLPTSREAPAGRNGCRAVWTGSEMIIFGGYAWGGVTFDTGARYDPVSDHWTPMNSTSGPGERGSFSMIWTGELVIIWGGWAEGSGSLATGWSYDPSDDSWVQLPPPGTFEARHQHEAIWTGTEMIVWGGISTGEYENTGARYNPATRDWANISYTWAPTGRTGHTMVWSGSEMIVWGGGYGDQDTGGRYNPSTNSWTQTTTSGAPEGRNYHTAVWAGDRMIVWGGDSYQSGYRMFATGGRYDPVSDSWTPTFYSGAPAGRGFTQAVWTGNLMIVWGGGYWAGGDGLYIEPLGSGGRYDPVTDAWTPTSGVGAPAARFGHTAVWTGHFLVVWGGEDYMEAFRTGGRYEPIGDVWGETTLTDAPSARDGHTAVWSGDEMIVWGGNGAGYLNSGARYDPYANVWSPASLVDAPSERSGHAAIWSGDEMIVWGGRTSSDYWDTGGRYDPVADSWTPTSTIGAPSARDRHTAVWGDHEMIVWGGDDDAASPAETGGRYAPATDSWLPISTVDGPGGRVAHTAVWVAGRMIVWGGSENVWGGEATSTGGTYDPIADSWAPTSMEGAPSPRDTHVAVATDDAMIVWGGVGPLSDGGRLLPFGPDADDDGFGCVIDCDDGDGNTYPGAAEYNDGLDNQCAGETGYGLVDEISGVAGFLGVGDKHEFSFPPQPGATGYEIARSTLADFSADCTVWLVPEAGVKDTEVPAGSVVFHYLGRSVAPHVGSWGLDSQGVERTGLCP